jgi:hypothetical protein
MTQAKKANSRPALFFRRFIFSFILSFLSMSPSLLPAMAQSWSQNPSWSQGDAIAQNGQRAPQTQERARPVGPFGPESNNISLDIGQVILFGDLSENYLQDIGFQMTYTYGVSDIFGFQSSLGYSSHSEGDLSILSALTGIRMNLSWYDRIVPYGNMGMGFYRPRFGGREVRGAERSGGSSNNAIAPVLFGIHLGGGADLEISQELYFGAALTLHNIFSTYRTRPDGELREVGGTYATLYFRMGYTF